jgi:aminoglycoside phosphotransferase (APT) family kinase protein
MAHTRLVEVRPAHRFDEARLWHYLCDHLVDFPKKAGLQQFQGGQSNPTFLITTRERQYVLRKQPPGDLLPSAHAVDREYRVQAALKDSPVPVVAMRHFCADPAIIGTPFYVMDYIPGRIFADPALGDVAHESRRDIYFAFIEVLAALHEIDFEAAGLGDFGKPLGYSARQVRRWAGQYEASKTGDIPAMDKLAQWLAAHAPERDEAAITHGDYKLNNLMYELGAPHVIAVLDWELSTLGHPLADLGYVCMGYRISSTVPMLGGLGGLDLPALGIPSEAEIVAHYCERAGRETPLDLSFFIALAFFRYAAIAQGVYKRALQGNAADARAHLAGEAAKALAEEGWRIAELEG